MFKLLPALEIELDLTLQHHRQSVTLGSDQFGRLLTTESISYHISFTGVVLNFTIINFRLNKPFGLSHCSNPADRTSIQTLLWSVYMINLTL